MFTKPENELKRLESLFEYQLLDTEPEQEYDDIVKIIAHICDTPIALIALLDEKRKWHKATCGTNSSGSPREITICSYTITQSDTLIIPDTHLDERFSQLDVVTKPPHVRFYAGVPLITNDGYALGTLCLIDTKPRDGLTEQQQESLEAMARQVMRLFELRRMTFELENQKYQLKANVENILQLNDSLQLLCMTDSLTQLANRRALFERLENEYSRAKRYKSELSIMMLDIDHFKQFNDSFGHQLGDDILEDVATLLTEHSRDSDLVARYGGEEFTIIMPNIGSEQALQLAERVRQHIEEHQFGQHSLTISIGVASITTKVNDTDTLISHADTALYSAKDNGRNNVILFK